MQGGSFGGGSDWISHIQGTLKFNHTHRQRWHSQSQIDGKDQFYRVRSR